MAGSFLSGITDCVLGKIASSAIQEIDLAWGVESELRKLESTLSAIRAVLFDAESKQAKNLQLINWLSKLKDVVYDADDLLDEFQYQALRSQVVKAEGSSTSTRRKVSNFFSLSNSLAFHVKMGHRVKDIRERLDDISAEKTKFHLTERVEDVYIPHKREMTHSFVRPSDVIGREEDKNNLIKHLIHMVDDRGENLSVIPIVGIGGLGKTTLAKLVYNNDGVNEHFQIKIWVCVSDEFDISKLMKEIIKSANVENVGESTTFDQLQTCLRNTLRGKRFLLVLDDVWNEDRGKWIELRNLLLDGSIGSKILVTTRSPLVASIMGTGTIYELRGLSYEDCSSLFVKWAFSDEGQETQYANLMKIGNEIVKKCRGVPLAVRTLGSLLYLKTDERDWLFIRDNEVWKLEQRENDILPALRLSYEQLPSHLKDCFACCSLFPKGYRFKSCKLIQLWMALGLIRGSDESQEFEEKGERYVKELLSRSFFQDDEVHTFYTEFKMHDLVHDLALLVSQNECSAINFGTKSITRMVRNVSFCDTDSSPKEVPTLLLDLKKLRTIMFPIEDVGPSSTSFIETCVSRFKFVRVLDMSHSRFEVLPSSIGDLKHLRLLNLFMNRWIKKLPKSICKLQQLQTLRLDGCFELEELPRYTLENLISLRSLYITTKQTTLEIGCLTSLRFLSIVACSNLKSFDEGIKGLIALRTLFIGACDNLESLPCSLRNLNKLENLLIVNSGKIKVVDLEEDERGLPRLTLQMLYFVGLPQLEALPQWLQGSADTLSHMHIKYCSKLSMLPAWLQDFTSLRTLDIIRCYKLQNLPDGLDRLIALKELMIRNCPELSRSCQPEIGTDWPKIAHVKKIILDGEKIQNY